MMRKKWISILLFCMAVVCSNAQTAGYKFYAVLDSVKKSGFYNIEITPELSAHLKTDYSDLRIVNDSGKWVPHVLHNPASEKSDMALYMDLRIIEKETAGSFTTVIIAAGQNVTSSLVLNMRNTAAERFCTLSGSDDNNNWFVINDSILINPKADEKSTDNIFTLDFPPSSYRFFKILINNKNKDPFDIKYVMTATSASKLTAQPRLVQNPPVNIEQKDSGSISYIKVTQQQPFHFDQISIKLDGVKYFSRNVELRIPYSADHSVSNPGQLVQTFTISNNSTLQFPTPLAKAAVFYLLIHNEDNLPLKVITVNTSSGSRFITSYLEAGNKYTLIMESTTAIQPNYDLSNIIIKFSDSIPLLSSRKITPFNEPPAITSTKKNNHWILWTSIIAALIILLLFTRKMIKEVDKRKDNDSI